MNAKIFKNIISAIPDDAEIMLETKPDEEWQYLKSIQIRYDCVIDNPITLYFNFSDLRECNT